MDLDAAAWAQIVVGGYFLTAIVCLVAGVAIASSLDIAGIVSDWWLKRSGKW